VGQAVSPASHGALIMSRYHRRLPHWHPDGAWVFLTWRLFGSLPRLRWSELAQAGSGRAFVALDRQADQATSGPLWLRDPRIATVVAEALRAGQRERDFYVLRAWVVMPNHVHALLRPFRPLAVITRWLKGATARSANLVLGHTGQPFWQDESWDRWVRSQQELQRGIRYIEHTPVAAGLVAAAEDWPWSSAGRVAGETACPTGPEPGIPPSSTDEL